MPRALLLVLALGGLLGACTVPEPPAQLDQRLHVKAGALKYVILSSRPDIWRDPYILDRLKSGTEVKKIKERLFEIVPGRDSTDESDLTRYYVEVVGRPSVKGWIHSSDVVTR